MTPTIFRTNPSNNFIPSKRLFQIVSVLFIFITALTVIQDFLEANRLGYSFYFSESILFKTIWILFIPFLVFLGIVLQYQNLDSFPKTIISILVPILVHLAVLPLVVLFFSVLFYSGRYGIYKVLTYTLTNDFYKLVLIYSGFVLGYKYLSSKTVNFTTSNKKMYLKHMVIGNGKNNTIVNVDDIFQITAATPYISIQLESKKYLHLETLKSIENQLDQNSFLRIHKSTIINLNQVASFKSRLNGDYDILLKNGKERRLSRTYVANFKDKFKGGPSSYTIDPSA